MSRKRNLVDFGFRLPSAVDNRPLTGRSSPTGSVRPFYLSATPGSFG